jgi:hypothetical protein
MIFDDCCQLAIEDYKLIPSLIRLEWEELSSRLYGIILYKHLDAFLPSDLRFQKIGLCLLTYFLHRLLNRWTDIFILP